MSGGEGGGNVQEEKVGEGKLRRVWCDSGGVVNEATYEEAT